VGVNSTVLYAKAVTTGKLSYSIALHIKPIVHFVIQAPNLADVLIDILGTKLGIGLSQIRTLVGVAAIFQNGHQRLVKIFEIIEITYNNGHN